MFVSKWLNIAKMIVSNRELIVKKRENLNYVTKNVTQNVTQNVGQNDGQSEGKNEG